MPSKISDKAKKAADKAAAAVIAAEDKKVKLVAKDKAKRDKVKSDKRSATERKAKGAVTTALKTLAPIAKDINVRMEKAAKMEDDAYDHRLAVALRLAEVNKICAKTKGITFKGWCGENVDQRYDTCSRLASVGRSDNPQLALEDLRVKNKLANQALRDRVAEEKAKQPSTKKTTTPSGKQPPKMSTPERVEAALASTDKAHAQNIIFSLAEGLGFAVVTAEEAKAARAAAKDRKLSDVERAKTLISKANGSDQMALLSWLAAEVGVDLPDTFAVPEADTSEASMEDLTEVPEFLQRDAKKGKTKSRRKAA